MTRKLISSGPTFEAEIGYSRAVSQGDWVVGSGTTGFDYSTLTISDDVLERAAQCVKNIEAALMQAGSCLEDVVRVTYVVPDDEDSTVVTSSMPSRFHWRMEMRTHLNLGTDVPLRDGEVPYIR